MTTLHVNEAATDLDRRQAAAHEVAAQRYPEGHKKRLQHLKAAARLRGDPVPANERDSGQRRTVAQTEESIRQREAMLEVLAAGRKAYRATQLLHPGPFHMTRTAKKSWRCEECNGAIPAGSRYLDTSGDCIDHNRYCLSCAGQELSAAK
jgi:hypothetical protein